LYLDVNLNVLLVFALSWPLGAFSLFLLRVLELDQNPEWSFSGSMILGKLNSLNPGSLIYKEMVIPILQD
jgi:hypothetical protein